MLSPLEVANDLRPVLFRLARELRKETEQLGVTGRQVTILWLVKRSPGLTLRALAEEEGISPPALSGHVDRLESAGLLVRVRSEVDRRRVGLTLTAAGERLLRRVRERRTTWLAERLGVLEPDELAAIEAAVDPLLRLIGRPEDGGCLAPPGLRATASAERA
jgi:DNA-binding MarR family transcriptional regulator